MHRKTLAISLASLLFAGGATAINLGASSAALADEPTPTSAPVQAPKAHGQAERRARRMREGGPVTAVIKDLRRLERAYLAQGKPEAMEAVYKDTLARTDNARVRNYAHRKLAQLASQPANPQESIAIVRKSLEENLARLNQKSSN